MGHNRGMTIIGRALSIAGWCAALLMTVLWMRERHSALLAQHRAIEGAATERSARAAPSDISAPALTADSGAGRTQGPGAAAAGPAPRDAGATASGPPTLQADLEDTEAQVLELRKELKLQAERARDAEERAQAHEELRDSVFGAFKSAEGMAQMGARFLVSTQYGDLLRQLNVDDATRQEVGSIIEMAYAHMSKQGMDMLTGAQKEPLSDAAYARWMSEELSSVLSPQDLALFQQYHSSLPGGMAGQQMEMSLANFAGDLSKADRGVVRDALVHAMSSGSSRPEEGMAGMYGAARATLEGALGEQQLAIYDRYVQQQLALMKMATAVMGEPPESE